MNADPIPDPPKWMLVVEGVDYITIESPASSERRGLNLAPLGGESFTEARLREPGEGEAQTRSCMSSA